MRQFPYLLKQSGGQEFLNFSKIDRICSPFYRVTQSAKTSFMHDRKKIRGFIFRTSLTRNVCVHKFNKQNTENSKVQNGLRSAVLGNLVTINLKSLLCSSL